MDMKLLVLITYAIVLHSLPLYKKRESTVIDYSVLTACELRIQKNCIENHGIASKILGNATDTCAVQKLIDCFNKEKREKDCSTDDPGTVAYVDAFIKTINTDKCMDAFDFTQVQELFQSASVENVIEYTNAHRTYSSGDHDSWHYENNDSEGGDSESSSGDVDGSGDRDKTIDISSGSMQHLPTKQ